MPTSSGSTGPPGWIEDLNPWLQNSLGHQCRTTTSRTSSTGLRTSTRWDFTTGNPLGTGGQWAIPWGFENNVVAYNKAYFDQTGIKKLPDRFDDFIQLAVDLTDRSENRYGISTRGSKSWATIHPGFMTQYTREGAVDYTFNGSELIAEMDSDKAIEFTKKWIEMQHKAGPTSWTTYDYPNATGDLGDGKAMMVFDADSATYPKNKPGASKEAGNLAWYAGPAGAGRQLQDQPVDVELGDERQLAQQAACLVVHPVGHRQGLDEQGRRRRQATPTRCESRCSTPPSSGSRPTSSATSRPSKP